MSNYDAIIDAIAILYIFLAPLVWYPYVMARVFVRTSAKLRWFALFYGGVLIVTKTITFLALAAGDGINYGLLILTYMALIADVSIIAIMVIAKRPLPSALRRIFIWIAVIATGTWYSNFLIVST